MAPEILALVYVGNALQGVRGGGSGDFGRRLVGQFELEKVEE